MAKRKAIVNKNVCAACGECVHSCPREAIKVTNGVTAVVDETKCIGCGLCARNCPANCIVFKEGGEK